MPQLLGLLFILIIFVNVPRSLEAAQAATSDVTRASSSLSGRLTIGTEPAVGVGVLLTRMNTSVKSWRRTRTDFDGRYAFTQLGGGGYRVSVQAPSFVIPKRHSLGRSDLINLGEEETISGVDFALVPGGVITGRVTDTDGQPLIREEVILSDAVAGSLVYLSNGWSHFTDDRGIYRLYGVPAGRYRVSVGQFKDKEGISLAGGESRRPGTFYPGVTEQARAVVVEVHEGEEVTAIDFAVAHAEKTYTASGRVISEDTGMAVGNLSCEAMVVAPDGTMVDFAGGTHTNALGEFHLSGLTPGRYAIQVSRADQKNAYSQPVYFQIEQEDVAGLELTLQRGGIISGSVSLEGQASTTTADQYQALHVSATAKDARMGVSADVARNGSFEIRGLVPGRVGLSVWAGPNARLSPRIKRLEVNGQTVPNEIDVEAGKPLTGVRLILLEGEGVIQGQIQVQGGPADGVRFGLMIAQNLKDGPSLKIMVDARGHFFVDHVPGGTYELQVTPFLLVTAPNGDPSTKPLSKVKQVVTVGEGTKVDVTLTVDRNVVESSTP